MSDDINPEVKPRVEFGGFRFVEINPNPKVPILRCCPNHQGDVDYTIPCQCNADQSVNVSNENKSSLFDTSTSSNAYQSHQLNGNRIGNLQTLAKKIAYQPRQHNFNGIGNFQTSPPNNVNQPRPPIFNGSGNLQGASPVNAYKPSPHDVNGFSNNLNVTINDGFKLELPLPPKNFNDSFDNEADIVYDSLDEEMEIDDIPPAKKQTDAIVSIPKEDKSIQLFEPDETQLRQHNQSNSALQIPNSFQPSISTSDRIALNDSFNDDSGWSQAVGILDTSKESAVVKAHYVGMGPRYDMHGKFRTYLTDDADDFVNSEKVLGLQMDNELYRTLKAVFGHNEFLIRQKAAVVAILKNFDCFILMPAGDERSLCYQLPVILSNGITVVFSPSNSYIVDQVTKLRSLNIDVRALNAPEGPESTGIYEELERPNVSIKLLYVTPEMIGLSQRFVFSLQLLNTRGLLARFVIHDAHRISQFGNDFCPDYTRLDAFVQKFNDPHVPIVALAAFAAPKIVTDIRSNLAIPNSKLFINSYVRDNIKYDVQPKSASFVRKLILELKNKFSASSGIVYCFSQKDTESLAVEFQREGVSAEAYHDGLTDLKRTTIRNDWMTEKVSVICFTSASGMDIDKPNVRFIVHHSIPRSMEDYYQETGCAGKDGLLSDCIILYSYQDHVRLRKLLESDNNADPEIVRHHKESIYGMVNYCENISTCRRKMIVEHFGEIYDHAACQVCQCPCTICDDISEINKRFQLYDVTDECHILINGIRSMNNASISYVSELYRGALSKKNQDKPDKSLPIYGRGSTLNEADAVRLLRKLVIDGYLNEIFHQRETLIIPSEMGLQLADQRILTKIYIHLSTEKKGSRTSNGNDSFSVTKVTESAALKEKYRLKNPDLFTKCKYALLQFFRGISLKKGYPTYTSIISREGLDQLAALMPRTNSELLQIDSLTKDKATSYSAQIMGILKEFWIESDTREHDQMIQQVEHLKNSRTAKCITTSPSASNNGTGSKHKSPAGKSPAISRIGNGKVTKRTSDPAKTRKSDGSPASKSRKLLPKDI